MKKTILLLILFGNILLAITLSPLTKTLDSKKEKYTVFSVLNPTKDPVAVDISILEVIATDTPKEQRVNTSKVTYYPTQFILNPKENKKIRIRYMGSDLPQTEEVFRVIAKELDIDVSDKVVEDTKGKIKTVIKLRFTYEGLLFIHKSSAEEKLSLTNINKTNNSLQFNINNQGTKSIVPDLSNYNFIVKSKSKEYKLTKEDMKGFISKRVLAGKSNSFTLFSIISIPISSIESMRLEKIE